KITLSAGIAIYNSDEESFEETLKRADAKLYQSKESGRNRVSI
ncbi:MAG: diguanylate cyclase, partial [Desulfobacteraceae bacterium]|nr:diguanylate cyclase [Desulfobacteraceae bacterium]